MFSKKCKEHLDDVSESGAQHMFEALWVALKLQALVPICIVHAFAPCLFTATATNEMKKILKKRESNVR
jgi:hypothetical protein